MLCLLLLRGGIIADKRLRRLKRILLFRKAQREIRLRPGV